MISDIESFFATQRVPGAVVPVFAADPTITPLGGLLSKACTKCGVEKPLKAFAVRKRARDGRQPWCRTCAADAVRRYQQTPEGRAKKVEAKRRWQQSPEGRAKKAEAYRRWRQTPEGRAWRAEYKRFRRQTDLQTRIANRLRTRLHHALKGVAKSARTLDLLGCTLEHLIQHLESRFSPGMSWANHGEWHIDHIRPLSSFDLTDPAQQRVACHWTNLQPLWAAENIRKSDKLEQPCHYQFIPCTLPLL